MTKDQKIIIYDGECRFCRAFTTWSSKKNNTFAAIPVKSKEARKLLREAGIQFVSLQTIYLIDSINVYKKSAAVFRILDSIGFPWRAIGLFSILPLKWTDYLYDTFARYRYRL